MASILKRCHLDRWSLCLICYALVYGYILSINLSYNSMLWDEVTHFTGGLLLSRGQVVTWVTTNSLYPPIYDIFVALYYLIAGPSVYAARLVALTFCVLSLFVIYEIANQLYSKRVALVSAVMFSVMPGIIWLSRLAMIETMLIFIFSLSMLFFFSWIQTNKERDRTLAIATFAIGAAVKYQVLVIAPIIMLLAFYFWKREDFKRLLKSCVHFPRVIALAVAVAVVAAVVYELSATGLLSFLLFVLREGTQQKAMYSAQYAMPVFYLVEMTWFNNIVQPISLLLYLAALSGLGYMVYRRKRQDKYLLLWFSVVYVVFSLIPNKDWRYVTIAFPVLAIATGNLLVATWDKLVEMGRKSLTRQVLTKVAACLLIVFVAVGVYFSAVASYNWEAEGSFQVPVKQASFYVTQNLKQNQSVVVVCPVDSFNQYMVWYYLYMKNANQNFNNIWQYPSEAADAYTPNVNATQFIALCQQHNARYVLLYEFGNQPYFDSSLTAQNVYNMLNQTGQFTLQETYGTAPNRIFVLSFAQQG